MGSRREGSIDASMKDLLRRILRAWPLNPMQCVLRKLRRRDIKLKDLDVLEVFGGSGEFHTRIYAPKVATLEVWEVDPNHEMILKKHFPNAEVKITDSFKEITTTQRTYDLVVIDNPMSTYGQYCEHFDLFPNVFRVARRTAILVLNVIPEIDAAALKKYPYLFNAEQLARRKTFYSTDTPEKILLRKMLETYKQMAEESGFIFQWCFFQRRSFVYYLVLRIKKSGRQPSHKSVEQE